MIFEFDLLEIIYRLIWLYLCLLLFYFGYKIGKNESEVSKEIEEEEGEEE